MDDLTVNCVVMTAFPGERRQQSVKWFKFGALAGVESRQHAAAYDGLDARQNLVAGALDCERTRRIASVEPFRAMMLDLLTPLRGLRFLVAALVGRWAVRIGLRGHGAMLCKGHSSGRMIPAVTK